MVDGGDERKKAVLPLSALTPSDRIIFIDRLRAQTQTT